MPTVSVIMDGKIVGSVTTGSFNHGAEGAQGQFDITTNVVLRSTYSNNLTPDELLRVQSYVGEIAPYGSIFTDTEINVPDYTPTEPIEWIKTTSGINN